MPNAPTAATIAVASPARAACHAPALPDANSPSSTTTGNAATRVEAGQLPSGSYCCVHTAKSLRIVAGPIGPPAYGGRTGRDRPRREQASPAMIRRQAGGGPLAADADGAPSSTARGSGGGWRWMVMGEDFRK